ncbi:MAG: Hsp70 family protein [Rubrivivax sp.]|nr:Hsp70 family protein [Rubrivivax sp.]
MQPQAPWCAIDFGTSNSAVALPLAAGGLELVPLEARWPTMPTAVFYASEGGIGNEPHCEFGRAAVAAYVDGLDGRLMRSMKSILGSPLLEQTTDVGAGRSVRYGDVVATYLRHLKRCAEAHAGRPLRRAVLGRPVHFVDDDPVRDRQAQQALEAAARRVGFEELHFQFEPIAAALDHESRLDHEQCVLVADIGGGTSDFSVVRLSPERRQRMDRQDDILANHGVHLAGTDFDRRVSLASLMPLLGLGSRGPARAGQTPREVPSGIYFDLASWHLINTVYAPARLAEQRQMRSWYADERHHRRLMTVLLERLGHALAAAAEEAKIQAASGGQADIDLGWVESGLRAAVSEQQAGEAIELDCARIETAAVETARRAGLRAEQIDAVYLTGGSTGLRPLAQRIVARFPRAQAVQGDPFASVARGLGEAGLRLFGPSP